MYCLGPKATVIGAAGTCKVRTAEVSVTEESRNNRLNNKSLLFMGTSRENPRLLGVSLVLWDIPELPIQQTKFPGRGAQISYRYGWARGSAPQTSFTGSMAWRAILRDSRPGPIPKRNVTFRIAACISGSA